MSGESVFGWIKVIVALAILALIGFLLWKLLGMFGDLGKFFQGTGKFTSLFGKSTLGKPAPGDAVNASSGIGVSGLAGIKDRANSGGFFPGLKPNETQILRGGWPDPESAGSTPLEITITKYP